MNNWKKAFSFFLCMMLCVSLTPTWAMAENVQNEDSEVLFSEAVVSEEIPFVEETVSEDSVLIEQGAEEAVFEEEGTFPGQDEEELAETEEDAEDSEEPKTEEDRLKEELSEEEIAEVAAVTPEDEDEERQFEETDEEELFEVEEDETAESEGEEEKGVAISEDGSCTINTMEDLKELVEAATNAPDRSFRATSSGGVFTITEDITIPANLKIDYFSSEVGSLAVAEDVTVDNYGTIFWATELELRGTVINRPGATMTADQWDDYWEGIGAVGYIALLSGSGTIVNYGTLYLNGASTVNRVDNQNGGIIHLKEPQLKSMEAFNTAIELVNQKPYVYLSAVMREPMNIIEDLSLPDNVESVRCAYSRDGYGLIISQGVTVTCQCHWEVNTPADIQGTLRNNATLSMSKAVRISGVLENNGRLQLPSEDIYSITLNVEESGSLINHNKVEAFDTHYSFIRGRGWIETGHRVMTLNGSLVNDGSFEVGEVSGYGNVWNSGQLKLQEGAALGSLTSSGTVSVMGGMLIRNALNLSGPVSVNLLEEEDMLTFAEGCSYSADWSGPETLGSITAYVANEARSTVDKAVSGLDFENNYTVEQSNSDFSFTYTIYSKEEARQVTKTICRAFMIRPKSIPESPFFPVMDKPYNPSYEELEVWRKDTRRSDSNGWLFTSSYGLAALMHDYANNNYDVEYHYAGAGDLEILVNIQIPKGKHVYISPDGEGKRVSAIIPEGITLSVNGGQLTVSDLEVYGRCSIENAGIVNGQKTLLNDGLLTVDAGNSRFTVGTNGYAGNGTIRTYGSQTPDQTRLEGIDLARFDDEYNEINNCHILTPLAEDGLLMIRQPEGVQAAEGEDVLFAARARGANLQYSWFYRSAENAAWQPVDFAEASGDSVRFVAAAEQNGYALQCRVSSGEENVISEIARLTVEHVPGEAVRENEIPATFDTEGSFDEVVRCTVCEAELEKTHQIVARIDYYLGETELQLVARDSRQLTVFNREGKTVSAKWSCSDYMVALMFQDGYLIAENAGKTMLYAEVDGIVLNCSLRVLFTDVYDSNAYFYQPVYWAFDNGITAGTSLRTFSPGNNCTRGQIVTFLWKAMGSPEPSSTENPFSDVTESDYYYKPVLWAKEKGVTSGTSAKTFSPGKPCTRGQIVTFLWKAMGSPEPSSTSNPFKDVKASDYFYKPVLWAKENGITSGTSKTAFSPGNTCTRAQAMTFLWIANGRPEV